MKLLKYRPVYFIMIVLLTSLKAESFKNNFFNAELRSAPNQTISEYCREYTCGPTTTITLYPNDVTGLSPNYEMGGKGFFKQMMNIGEAFGNEGASGVINHALKQHKVPTKVSTIHDKTTMVLPLIDYGFTGSFSHILITVSNEEPRYGYSSVTMGLTDKDDFITYAGTVTIEEYSPFIIRGSYSTPLKRYEDINPRDLQCPAFSDPSTPPCKIRKLMGTGNISGTFSISTPQGATNRYKQTPSSDDLDPFISDIESMAAAYGVDMDVDFDEVLSDAGVRSSNKGDVGGEDRNQCNCSCNYVKSATPECQVICKKPFSVCKGERYERHNKNITTQQKVESSNKHNKQVQKKEERMEKNMIDMSTLPPEAKEIMNQLPKGLMEKMMQQFGN